MSARCLASTLTSLLAARWRTSMLSSLQILPLPPRRPPSAWPLPLPHHRVPLAAPHQFLRPPLQGRAPMLRPRDHLTTLHPVWWHMHDKNVGVVPLSPHPQPALLQWLTCSLCYCGHGNEPEWQKLSLNTNVDRYEPGVLTCHILLLVMMLGQGTSASLSVIVTLSSISSGGWTLSCPPETLTYMVCIGDTWRLMLEK
jgi:hypothetical protein